MADQQTSDNDVPPPPPPPPPLDDQSLNSSVHSASRGRASIAESPSAMIFKKGNSVAPRTSTMGRFAGLQRIPSEEAVVTRSWGTKMANYPTPPPPTNQNEEAEFSRIQLKTRTNSLPPRPYGSTEGDNDKGNDDNKNKGLGGSSHYPTIRAAPPATVTVQEDGSVGSDSLMNSSHHRPILDPIRKSAFGNPTSPSPAGGEAVAPIPASTVTPATEAIPKVTPTTTTINEEKESSTTPSINPPTVAATSTTATTTTAPKIKTPPPPPRKTFGVPKAPLDLFAHRANLRPVKVSPSTTKSPVGLDTVVNLRHVPAPLAKPPLTTNDDLDVKANLNPVPKPPASVPGTESADTKANLRPVPAPPQTTTADAANTTTEISDTTNSLRSVPASPPKTTANAGTTTDVSDTGGLSAVETASHVGSAVTLKAGNPPPGPPLPPSREPPATANSIPHTTTDATTQTSSVDSTTGAASVDDDDSWAQDPLRKTQRSPTTAKAGAPMPYAQSRGNSHVDSLALGPMKERSLENTSYLPGPMQQLSGLRPDAYGSYDDEVSSGDESWLSPSLRGERKLDPNAKAVPPTATATATTSATHKKHKHKHKPQPTEQGTHKHKHKSKKRPRNKPETTETTAAKEQQDPPSKSGFLPLAGPLAMVKNRSARVDFTGAIQSKNWLPPSKPVEPNVAPTGATAKAQPKSALGGDEDLHDSAELDAADLLAEDLPKQNASKAANTRDSFDASGLLFKSASARLKHGLDGPGEAGPEGRPPSEAKLDMETGDEALAKIGETEDSDEASGSAASGAAVDASDSSNADDEESMNDEDDNGLKAFDKTIFRELSAGQTMDASGILPSPPSDEGLLKIGEEDGESDESSSIYADTPLEDVVDRSRSVSLDSPDIIPSKIDVQTDDLEQAQGGASPKEMSRDTPSPSSRPKKISRDTPSPPSRPYSGSCKFLVCLLLMVVPAGWAIAILYLFIDDPVVLAMNETLVPTENITPKPAPTLNPQPTRFPNPTEPPFLGGGVPTSGGGMPTPGGGMPSNIFAPTNGNDVLLELLTLVSADGGASLRDSTTPQFAAMEWIRTQENAGIYSDRRFLARYALATFYYSTRGEEWDNSTRWLTKAHECEWFSDSPDSPTCDENENIIEIDLTENNLRGTLPPELTLLNLQTILLSGNALTGNIPTVFGNFGQLTHLDLFDNALTSSIPSEVGRIEKLKFLSLGTNEITGQIPSHIGQLQNLVKLSLFDNSITGTIPAELGNLKKLENLYLDNLELGPSLPSEICDISTLKQFWSDCDEIGGCKCCSTCCIDDVVCL